MAPASVASLASSIGSARAGLHTVTRLVRQGSAPSELPRIAAELRGVHVALSPLASDAAQPALGAGAAYAGDALRAVALLERSVRGGIAPPARDVGQILARVELLGAHVATLG